MKEFEEILDEVRLYEAPNVKIPEPDEMVDGIEKNPDVQAFDTGYERVTLWNETDVRNDVLKTVALAAFTGACAYFDLMAAALYIPLGIACLCNVCYKVGIYRGRNED